MTLFPMMLMTFYLLEAFIVILACGLFILEQMDENAKLREDLSGKVAKDIRFLPKQFSRPVFTRTPWKVDEVKHLDGLIYSIRTAENFTVAYSTFKDNAEFICHFFNTAFYAQEKAKAEWK